MKRECWAKSIGRCSGGMSKEHIISKSLFEPGEVITVSGFDWTGGDIHKISIGSHSAKILCQKHNNALSPLDKEIKKIRDAFKKYYKTAQVYFEKRDRKGKEEFKVNGRYLERWILKTTINHITFSPKKHGGYRPFPYIVELVFGKLRFDYKKKWGLYLVDPRVINNQIKKPHHIAIKPILIKANGQNILMGSLLVMFGMPFFLKIATTDNISIIYKGINLLDEKFFHPQGGVLLNKGKIDRTKTLKILYGK